MRDAPPGDTMGGEKGETDEEAASRRSESRQGEQMRRDGAKRGTTRTAGRGTRRMNEADE